MKFKYVKIGNTFTLVDELGSADFTKIPFANKVHVICDESAHPTYLRGEKYMMLQDRIVTLKYRKLTIFTFDHFWLTFHRVTRQFKTHKELALKEWNKCVLPSQKKKAIKNIKNYKHSQLNGYEVLKIELNRY